MEIISKLNSLVLNLEDIECLNYFERCNILNSNAVVLTRHFQHRIEVFLKEILLIRAWPLEKLKYYAIRVEFQFMGSSRIHSFPWIPNGPTLNKRFF